MLKCKVCDGSGSVEVQQRPDQVTMLDIVTGTDGRVETFPCHVCDGTGEIPDYFALPENFSHARAIRELDNDGYNAVQCYLYKHADTPSGVECFAMIPIQLAEHLNLSVLCWR